MVSVAIVTHNSAATIESCLAAAEASTVATEVHVWDNASTDPTLDLVRGRPGRPPVVFASAQNIGFAAAVNRLVPHTRGDYILLLNPDCILEPATIATLLAAMQAGTDLAAVAPTLRGTYRGRSQAGGGWEPSIRRLALEIPALPSIAPRVLGSSGIWARRAAIDRSTKPLPVDWASGTCLLVRRADWRRVGGFDERWFMYCEDVDLGRRLRRSGRRSALLPAAQVRHIGGASHRTERSARELQRESMFEYVEHNTSGALRRCALQALLAVYFATRRVIPAPSGRSALLRWAHSPSSSA